MGSELMEPANGSQLVFEPVVEPMEPIVQQDEPRSEHAARYEQRDARDQDATSFSGITETPHTVLQYYRYLGPTAIAPGYKKISLKVRNVATEANYQGDSRYDATEQVGFTGIDPYINLPRMELLPYLLDAFFGYYGSYFCFLNRHQLESLIQTKEVSSFLLCSLAALSARFCDIELLAPYFPTLAAGQTRERWEYSLPFLNQAKALLMPLLSIPSSDLVAGLLFLALAEFGDNNEAGMWMFTGMSIRVAQELGLHRQRPSIYTSIGRSPTNDAHEDLGCLYGDSNSYPLTGTQQFEKSSQILLFWCVFVQDTSLANGTGRVPSIKRSEISIEPPSDQDVAIVKAGPSGLCNVAETCVFPHMVRTMLDYATSIEILNTDYLSPHGSVLRDQGLGTIETVRDRILTSYEAIPEAIKFGAVQYRSAVHSDQAIPYLVMHFNFHLQIAFLSQASHAFEHQFPRSSAGQHTRAEDEAGIEYTSQHRKSSLTYEDRLYRQAIKSIIHMLTIARFVDSRPLLSIFFLNQSFFHAACAYAGDMLRFQHHDSQQFSPGDKSSAFPLPSRSSTSVIVDIDELGESTGAPSSLASADSYLALLAKTNYQFLRQTITDMATYYAGAGWVDAVLDQRESGIRDVDLSIVSESISTYVRLHDLRGGRSIPAKSFESRKAVETDTPSDVDLLWSEDLLSGIPSDFDSQAFFDEYIFADPSNRF